MRWRTEQAPGPRAQASGPSACRSVRRKAAPYVLCAVVIASFGISGQAPRSFTVVDVSIADMQKAMADGRVTSRDLVQQSLVRIALYEDQLNAVITVNRRALEEADMRDRERAAGKDPRPAARHSDRAERQHPHHRHADDRRCAGVRRPVPPYEATVTRHLREAGAVIIAKTQMTELANWVTLGMPGNYNSLTGYGFNPYDPRRDPRHGTADGRPSLGPGGSSSGVGTAASFWAANVGTETSGSILNPSNQTMLVGIKPTVGRVSRYGIIPITADQDTAGPMARTVAGCRARARRASRAAPATRTIRRRASASRRLSATTRVFSIAARSRAPASVCRARSSTSVWRRRETTDLRGGLNNDQHAAMEEAIAALKKEGAVIVDPADIPSVVDPDRDRNFLAWDVCRGFENGRDAIRAARSCSSTA